jgi:hypothetical protein
MAPYRLRDMRRIPGHRTGRAALLAPLLLLALAGCGKDQSTSFKPAPRPATDARIQILQPTPNQETGPDLTVQVKLFGAREVDRQGPPLVPTEGHIHVSLDGNVVAMAYSDTQVLKGLTPGPHSVQVDYVATDHIPFSNRVTAGVLFTVK